MLKQITFCLTSVLLLIACDFGEPKKPDNLISKDKMVNVLIDAKLISSAISSNKKISEKHKLNMDTYVFKKHNIDSLQFSLSNDYYSFHIKEYEEIYIKVKDSLTKLKEKYVKIKRDKEEALEMQEQKKRDSIGEKNSFKKNIKQEGDLIKPVSETNSQL